jgi:malonyl CoA-acyl carrier protein transacylase
LAVAVIFPAFVNEYTGAEDNLLSSSDNNFTWLLEKASDILKADLMGFDFSNNNFLQDEEKTQYISYIFSCSVADILLRNNVYPSFISGYSMGIYAALYYCRSVSFDDGLKLVKNAWEIISAITAGHNYGMGMVIGLEEKDLLPIMESEEDIEICNRNNRHTYIISGSRKAVENVLASSKNEGALKTSMLPVSNPYHSRFLKSCVKSFEAVVNELQFSDPSYRYISALDQHIIETREDLRKEVILNLSEKMNWSETMNTLIKLGADAIFECGAGDGLTRNSRFIDGSFKSFSINKLEGFLKSIS